MADHPQESMGPTLPMDVIRDIVDELASTPTPQAYTYGLGVVSCLASLCLVSREVHRVSIKHLYCRIHLATQEQAHRFPAALPDGVTVSSLWLDESASNDIHNVNRLLLLLTPKLERVMLHDTDIIVTRVFLDAERMGMWSGRDFGILPALRELSILCWDNHRPPSGALDQRWPNLTRVASLGVQLPLLERCSTLEVIVVQAGKFSVSTLERIIHVNPNLVRFINLSSNALSPFGPAITPKKKRDLAHINRGRISFVDAIVPHGTTLQHHFEEHVRCGTIWKLDGVEWLSIADVEEVA